MRFVPTELAGVVLVESDEHRDERGAFVRTFDRTEFEHHGLVVEYPQHSLSHNRAAGTTRGLHLQRPPFEEAKLVRCVRGHVFDVIVDLRASSPTHRRWIGVELDSPDRAVYVPPGCAHGFQTLADDSLVHYLISVEHQPDAQDGVRWDDPTLAVSWPLAPSVMSARDRDLPLLER